MAACCCGSNLAFSLCCQPLLVGLRDAATPEQLMRSRFSAYCVKAIDYIANTYHQSQRSQNAVKEIAEFANAAYFLDLQVHAATEVIQLQVQQTVQSKHLPADTDAIGTVSFSARFIMRDKIEQIVEISRFVNCGGRWFYLDGQLTPTPAVKISRNDLCPCNSGKKYKICQHQTNRI